MVLIDPRKRYDKKKLSDLPIVGGKPENEKEEKWLREFETYEFYNLEEPGISQTISYGNTKNKVSIDLFHGGKYVFPRHLARFIESRSIPIYKYRPDGTGAMIKTHVGENPRFQMRQIMSA